jgi:bifunctional N-acetylglucosamine-1-phosphate-uridyltransferase/glucosamine-1-phosphate-acetyltransferase GlmU-like protein
MIHLVTLSGNSKRFTDRGYDHKALCDINGSTMVEVFVESWGDFHEHDNVFLCRDEDLGSGKLRQEIIRVAPDSRIFGIETNTGGPIYSISKIFDKLDDDQAILVSYIDTLQKTSIKKMLNDFEGYDAGMTIHNFKNPHWRNGKSYCLVEFNDDMNVTNVVEKHPFTDEDFLDKRKSGSSGNYYFKSCATMKRYFKLLINNNIKVNDEFYVTQAIEHMVKDGLNVKAHLCPYAALGVPEDLEDYAFWDRWHETNFS